MSENASEPTNIPVPRPTFAAPRSDISLAVEMISAERRISGTSAYRVLVQMAHSSRRSVGEAATLIARGHGAA